MSRETPEKNGLTVGVTETAVVAPFTPVIGVDVTAVTKNWSVPTLSTAFWLLSVAIRGLERTCTAPWVWRKVSNAAKFVVWNASPNRDAPGFEKLTRF